jgi:vancomycin permeability regulator SanA
VTGAPDGDPADRDEDVAVTGHAPGRRRTSRRRWLRRLWIGSLVVVLLGIGYVGVTFAQVVSTSHRDDVPNARAAKAQAIIVLGAAQYDGVPSPVLEARLDHALELYRWGIAPVVVVTGGRQPGDRFTEATTGYDYLRKRGVPDSAIRKEVHGSTTWESLRAASTFLAQEGISEVVLVSDGYHSKRLLEIAGEVGLDARVSPSTESLSGSTRLRAELRETVAVSIGRVTGFHLLDHR